MISQQHIIIQIIFTTAWILAVSLTTFIAFVSVAVWLGERQLDEDTFEDVINREFEKLSPKQRRFVLWVVFICVLSWMIVLLPGALAPFNQGVRNDDDSFKSREHLVSVNYVTCRCGVHDWSNIHFNDIMVVCVLHWNVRS